MHEVRPRDCVIHTADHFEHTFVAGPDGLEYLVYGTRHPIDVAWLPRSRAIRTGWPWVEGRDDDPWDVEAAGPAARGRRPEAAPREHPQRRRGRARERAQPDVGGLRGLRARRLRVGEARAREDGLGPPLPLRGRGDLRHPRGLGDLAPLAVAAAERRRRARASSTSCAPATSSRGRPAPAPRITSSPATTAARCSSTGRASRTTWRSTRARTRSRWRGLGVIGRVEHLDYWDGEER